MRRRQLLVAAPALLGVAAGLMAETEPAAATGFAAAEFQQTWQRDEAGLAGFWGDLAKAGNGFGETWNDAPGGTRLVQYFPSGRMEQTTPGGPVTSGALVREMVTGVVDLGGGRTQQLGAPNVRIFGSEADEVGGITTIPTFADLAKLPRFAIPGQTPLAYQLDRNRQWQASGVARTIAQGEATDNDYSGYVQDPTGTYQQTVYRDIYDVIENRLGARIAETTGYPITPHFKLFLANALHDVQVFERRIIVNAYFDDRPEGQKLYNAAFYTGTAYYNWRYANAK